MKEKIIQAAIESLRRGGLRFSVDTLAGQLKISKKTIYKIFPDKETLALAMYEKFYEEAKQKIRMPSEGDPQKRRTESLRVYFEAKMMTRKDIFNKYKLNASVNAYTSAQNDELWSILILSLKRGLSARDAGTVRIIVDGAFEKLCDAGLCPDQVIERLLELF